MNPIVFITGATAGFGEACALKFAETGYNLVITGRRKERLEKLKKTIEEKSQSQVQPLAFDVRDFEACEKAITSLPEEWKKVDILINNAGLAAGKDPIDQGRLEDWEAMIDTNVKGLLYISKLLIPSIKESKTPHIINLGSTAAKDAYPGGNVYNATKFAVEALSKAMRIDLLPYGVKVTAVHPGAADTEFSTVRFKGDKEKADQTYAGFTPLYAEDVAETIFFCATRPPHVCINDLVITCTAQANAFFTEKKES